MYPILSSELSVSPVGQEEETNQYAISRTQKVMYVVTRTAKRNSKTEKISTLSEQKEV